MEFERGVQKALNHDFCQPIHMLKYHRLISTNACNAEASVEISIINNKYDFFSLAELAHMLIQSINFDICVYVFPSMQLFMKPPEDFSSNILFLRLLK